MGKKVRVVQIGLGPIGIETARIACSRKRIRMAGAVDVASHLAGLPLSQIVPGAPEDVAISDDLEKVLSKKKPDVALLTTSSRLIDISKTLHILASHGVSVVSSCEELLFPWYAHEDNARQLSKYARKHGSTILGTGVNPGFVMDTFAALVTTPCEEVESVRVVRIVNAATRREPLQRKVGAGMKPEEFRALALRKAVGHVGIVESIALLAHGLDWELDSITELLEPKIATRSLKTEYFSVNKGEVAGIHHEAEGIIKGRAAISLLLEMYVGAPDPRDEITIKGKPDLNVLVRGGTPGDLATAAIMVNLIPHVLDAAPGIVTMLDLALPRYSAILHKRS